MSQIELDGVWKRFGDVEVIKGVDIVVEEGEFAVFVGPSGCGKSTLLRMIAGLESISDGEFRLGGERMNDVSPDRRGIAMVFQSYALYPHMTVAENIGFALSLKKVPKPEIRKRVGEVAAILRMEDLLARKPAELSGGQRQRVAIGRAIAKRPKVILFDEPLSNLDAMLRVQMRAEIQRLHQEFGSTIIYVTHDQVEALTMAQKIVVLKQGVVAQVGAPMTLYKAPQNAFVAQFIGSPKMNLLPARIEATRDADCSASIGRQTITVPLGSGVSRGDDIHIGIRPEHIAVRTNGDSDLRAKVLLVERLGSETYLHLDVGSEPLVVRIEGDMQAEVGDDVAVALDRGHCHYFDRSGVSVSVADARGAH